MLRNRKILLGVTGSIAAYKAAILIRNLVREGAEVRVIMTPLAKEFITPLTLATLSRNPILVDFFDPEDGRWNSHVSLGEWADAYVIAPATANTLAKMATGVGDNLLLTTYLSARCPVFAAPAMDLDMYAHPATQDNLKTLSSRGLNLIEPGVGELASGLEGKGRMADPEVITQVISSYFAGSGKLKGKKFMVTAGPTIEPIDPVRFISNYSSGKMGYAIAQELLNRGAEVTLISGPTNLTPPSTAQTISVSTAAEMFSASDIAFETSDGAVLCAAVSDYTPSGPSNVKIKKQGHSGINLKLDTTKDIAAHIGQKKSGKLLVGFALETDNEQENALKKLEAKNLDIIVLNSLKDEGAGFGTDTNKITIIHKDRTSQEYPLMDKKDAAAKIVDRIELEYST